MAEKETFVGKSTRSKHILNAPETPSVGSFSIRANFASYPVGASISNENKVFTKGTKTSSVAAESAAIYAQRPFPWLCSSEEDIRLSRASPAGTGSKVIATSSHTPIVRLRVSLGQVARVSVSHSTNTTPAAPESAVAASSGVNVTANAVPSGDDDFIVLAAVKWRTPEHAPSTRHV